MAETTVLRTSAIVRNASIDTTPPHGAVRSGQLPLVQVKMAPGGPQVQEGQQRPVEILPPRDEKAAIATGGLPLIQVKMTQNGPQIDNGREQAVVIQGIKPAGVATGGLPMLQVKMTQGGPQVQTLPTVKGGPPQIQAAPPSLSVARGARVGTSTRQVIAAPRQVALPPVPELTMEQLMLCRHLVESYLGTLRTDNATVTETASEGLPEIKAVAEHVQIAVLTTATLDEMLVATAVRAEAAAQAAAHAPEVTSRALISASGHAAEASISSAPSAAYIAGRVGLRPQVFAGARVQRNAALAPRRVAPADTQLPPVIVTMEGRRPVVQKQSPLPAPSLEAPAKTTISSEDMAEGAPQS